MLAEVAEEAVWELLSAEDPDGLTVGLWPSCWRRDAGSSKLGRQLIRDENKFPRLETEFSFGVSISVCEYVYFERGSILVFQKVCV